MDYSKTLNLPQTEFPMKASLATREPEIQEKWNEWDLYHAIRNQAKGKAKFILHDGPPYANGDVHMGTAFNKISKDIIVKYKSMRGFDAPYIPGWDCHGMPIEHKVVGQLSEEEAADRLKVRKECRNYAAKFVDHQRSQFKRLGVLSDWDNPYLTMNKDYQAAIVKLFGKLAVQNYIYRGLKPVHWCTECQSALAEAEVEYAEHISPSITVSFELVEGWAEGLGIKPALPVFVPIWTTTPWTLPANRAISVHPDFSYALVQSEDKFYIVAKELVESNWKAMEKKYEIVSEIAGNALGGMKCKHPFLEQIVPIITGEHVTLENGTGCVHTAPGHGQEDFIVGKENNIEIVNPVGPDGRFTAQFSDMQGEFVFDANRKIVDLLKEKQALMHFEKITHSYPHCWRHHTPIIFRATEQWFMNVDKDELRKKIVKMIDKDVQWIPEISQNRIASMIEGRPDWCLSRQRAWGVAVPIFYCKDCSEPLINEKIFKAVEKIIAAESADAWFVKEASEILPEGLSCTKCQGITFRKETDILDVWFDSGVSHAAVVEQRKELSFPADLYLEGSDQHRGWFQVSLLTSVATTGQAPYRSVLTHGYIVDGKGKKMSKSLGNFISSTEAIKRYGGADILRLWVVSENIQNDVRASDEIFKRVVDAYRRIRNSIRFLLGNLHGFAPAKAVKRKDMELIDKLMLHRLNAFVQKMEQGFEKYEFHRLFHIIQNFCSTDLSAFYFDVMKDRLYADGATSSTRLSAQTTLWHILNHLVRVVAPILVHTAEETWQAMKIQALNEPSEELQSVHLLHWITIPKDWQDDELSDVWETLFEIRSEVTKQLEEVRNKKIIRHSYEAIVSIKVRGEKRTALAANKDQLATFFVVSDVFIEEAGSAGPEMIISVELAKGNKCERCWRVLSSVGTHEDHPGLCDRCQKVISLMDDKDEKVKKD